ncbi:hypothetical protein DICVIV_00024 [Dictyocaulus viviparus]|uniref:Uncharacterized protein n=1 Tax=Dictyocaulus viviparus TaxID=29172 RepID=A0A0D8YG03_DICVI|nr:hypothetical protein DICVIV_00024 [Dictyocaulus viviparus]
MNPIFVFVVLNWDCGLENLAKGELDRAEKATKDFPLSDVAAQYYTLTSKGKNLRSALAKIPPLFLEDSRHFLQWLMPVGCMMRFSMSEDNLYTVLSRKRYA